MVDACLRAGWVRVAHRISRAPETRIARRASAKAAMDVSQGAVIAGPRGSIFHSFGQRSILEEGIRHAGGRTVTAKDEIEDLEALSLSKTWSQSISPGLAARPSCAHDPRCQGSTWFRILLGKFRSTLDALPGLARSRLSQTRDGRKHLSGALLKGHPIGRCDEVLAHEFGPDANTRDAHSEPLRQ